MRALMALAHLDDISADSLGEPVGFESKPFGLVSELVAMARDTTSWFLAQQGFSAEDAQAAASQATSFRFEMHIRSPAAIKEAVDVEEISANGTTIYRTVVDKGSFNDGRLVVDIDPASSDPATEEVFDTLHRHNPLEFSIRKWGKRDVPTMHSFEKPDERQL